MNLHPILVHFPVALLTIYALLELARVRVLTSRPYWFYIKATFAIFGAGAACLAFLSGKAIEDAFRADPISAPIMAVHSKWALATTILFCTVAAFYVIAWIEREFAPTNLKGVLAKTWTVLRATSKAIVGTWAAPIVALAGLASVTITGALGGAIVYGPKVDPAVDFIYRLFFH